MRAICYGFFGLGTLVSLAGFLGAVHPAGDSFAVLRPACVAGFLALVLVCLIARFRRLGVASLMSAVLLAGTILIEVAPGARAITAAGAPPQITLYQKNMLFVNRDWREIAADIRALEPDVVTLQEVSARNRPILDDLADLYPHQQFCSFSGVGGTAVLSRLPPHIDGGTCPAVRGLAVLRAQGPKGPVWLMSLHLHWPWPYGQAAQARAVETFLDGTDGPRVLGGDFNMIPWSHRLRRLEGTAHGQRAGPAQITFSVNLDGLSLYPMPIDHVIGPRGGDLTRRPRLGSDHFGLLARLPL